MKEALSPTGVLCTQGECQWLHLELIEKVMKECKNIFPSVKYAYTSMPTYPSGQIGFIIASNDSTLNASVPSRSCIEMDHSLRYYSEDIHKVAFILPAFAAKKIGNI